ncbi:MAG: ABC transporter permease [Actinobacteria bacterium]|nr:ABC transporter permease [Actinomycetota bacterium]
MVVAKRYLVKYNLLLIFVLLCVVGSIVSPNFATTANISNVLQQTSLVGIVSIGMTFVILTGNIDLSVGSVAAFAGMIIAIFVNDGMNLWLSVLLGILCGVISGAVLGGLSAFLTVPSFMTTLAGLVGIRGATYLLSDGVPVSGIPAVLTNIGTGRVGGIPDVGIIFISIALLAAIALRFTVFGEHLYATGSNEVAARLSGVNTKLIVASAFAICGALAALAGVLLTARLTVGQPTAYVGLELDAIAAVVLGGTSLFGGRGGVFGTVIAVFMLAVIRNVFNLMGLGSFYQMVITGVVLIIALVLNRIAENRGKR